MERVCPTCDREFEGVSDYPLVFVSKFVRATIPEITSFQIRDNTIYVGPKSECGNPRPPKEVLEYFKENQAERKFQHDGWDWVFEADSHIWSRKTNLSIRDTIKKLLGAPDYELKPKIWEVANYNRSQKEQFAKDTVMKNINPYLDRLESYVGKEVPSSHILPKFDTRYGYNRIPETQYQLTFNELDRPYTREFLTSKELPIPDLETPEPTRKVVFAITECSGGSISVVHYRAIVGGLAYEGRLKNN